METWLDKKQNRLHLLNVVFQSQKHNYTFKEIWPLILMVTGHKAAFFSLKQYNSIKRIVVWLVKEKWAEWNAWILS